MANGRPRLSCDGLEGDVLQSHIHVRPAGQGVAPTAGTVDEFDELVAPLRDGVTYANVHSSKFPGGAIRGQIFDVPQKGRD